jgi:hypothetical protein
MTDVGLQTGTGTLFTDDDGFVGMILEFDYHAKHPASGVLLREFLAEIPGAAWNKPQRAWVVPDVADIPRGLLKSAGFTVVHADGSPARPSDLVQFVPPDKEPVTPLSDVPDWFGIEPYAYQRNGAILIAQGKHFLADDPGVGKTISALCAAAILQSKRTLVLCPPVVLTHWERSAIASGLPQSVGGEVVVIKAGKAASVLPETGVVIASSALVAGRVDLAAQLAAWQPTVFVLDEAHHVKTWSSRRSRVLRRLSQSCTVTIPTTGTPGSASPLELAGQMELSGDLGRLFGSYLEYRARYTRKTKWGYVPVKSRLPELRKILDEQVWVRRTKAEVQPDLPPKLRVPMWVDVNITEYRKATAEISEAIDEWLGAFFKENGRLPSNDQYSQFGDEVLDWCRGKIGLVARLRSAAGLAKIDAASDFIKEHFEALPCINGVYPSPLIVWAHHKPVVAALAEAARDFNVAVIDGSTSKARRDQHVDDFQDGRIGVLVCSIQAAGVGITLTASDEALFVETNWNPPDIVQAEDRQHRIGQKSATVTYTTMIAKDTIDERTQAVLYSKSGVLGALMDGDFDVAHSVNEKVLASGILADMVAERIKKRRKTKAS